MRKNKLLALILTLCMLFTTIGSITVANAADAVTVINVGQGVTYLLPDGETYADTSMIGYRIIEGTDGVTYRVNVGEYKVIMSDDFKDYSENQYTAAISNREISGGTFTKAAYADDTDSAQKLTKDGTNTVAAFGPHTSSNTNFLWNPTDRAKGEAFKISYKLRVASFDLDTAGVGTASGSVNYFFTNNLGNTGAVQLRAYVTENNGVRSIGNTQLRCQGNPAVNADISDFIEWTEPDENNIISMKNYITVEIEGNNLQYSANVNGDEVANSVLYSSDAVSKNGVASIIWAKRNSDGVDTVIYADDMVYSKAIYVTDTLSDVTVPTVTLAKGDAAAQTATVTLNMSDKTTKDFTVKFNADTTTPGTGYTTQGTIDGFDDTVTVTYTVLDKTSSVINTFVNADAVYADGTAVDTSALGRKYKTFTDETGVTEYTVNVGGWDVEYADDMSQHTNTTVDHDNNELTSALDIVAPATSDDFKLTPYPSKTATSAAVITADSDNAVLKFTKNCGSDHLRWVLSDGFDGSFKYSMRAKVVASKWNDTDREELLRIDIYNTAGDLYFRGDLMTPKTSDKYSTTENKNLMMRVYYSGGAADVLPTTVEVTTNASNMYETGWFTIEVIGKADTGTRDVYVNGTLSHRDYGYINSTEENITDSTFKEIRMAKRYDTNSEIYVDDVSISSYYKFEGDLPSGQEVLVGKDTAAEGSLALTFSNGDVKNIPATMPDLDTSKLGTISTSAVLTGFDETTTVNAKVCNYDISALGFAASGASVTAPVAGGTVADATFTNAGNYTHAKAIFAWYNSQGKLEVSKIADLADIAKGETKNVSVNMQLPNDITGGVLKVFVVNSLSDLIPIDISALYDSFTQD